MSSESRLPTPLPRPTIQREVIPSASDQVCLALVQVPGPVHDIEAAPYLRVSFNLGPSYSFEAIGSNCHGTFACKHHSLLIIPPDTELTHCATTPKPVGRSYKPARLATFRISRKLLVDSAMELRLPPERAELRHQVIASDDVLRMLAQSLFADLRAASPDGARATERLTMALVTRLLLREQRLLTNTTRPGMEQVRTFIDKNSHEALALEDLARIVGMSQFHFCRVFRNHVGTTPHQYILGRRMDQAKRLLWANGDVSGISISMLEIALACDFNSPSHFAAQFKRHTGSTPLQWQRSAVANRSHSPLLSGAKY